MKLSAIWVYLASQPLLWLAVTLSIYWLAKQLYDKSNGFSLLNPVLISVSLIVVLLLLTNTEYDQYFDGAQFIHFLLGPATVALAVPLIDQLSTLKKYFVPIAIALFVGSLVGILSTIALCWVFGISGEMLLSLLPRSITTPIAMGISDEIGGRAELTVVFVVITGILGAAFGMPLLGKLAKDNPIASGFALGVTSHGIGTARAFEQNQTAGAFAGLAMGLNGALTAALIPLIVWALGL